LAKLLQWLTALACLHSVPVAAQLAPAGDHHQHVFSPAMAEMLSSPGKPFPSITGRDVAALLEVAGIRRGVLLSTGYLYSSPSRQFSDEQARVRAENDWNAAQAAEFPDRLVAFCSVNPLKDYALDEIERCAKDVRFGKGLKMHFGNSDVQLEDPKHLDRLREVFRHANRLGMALVIHTRASISRKRPYGAVQARAFIELLPAAADVVVQVAHMAGTGPGFDDPPAHEVLAVLADAMEKRDPRVRNLWFDVASVAHPENPPAVSELLARRIRQVGVGRIVYGTDSAAGDNLRPRESWAAFRKLPLSEAQLDQIARNVAPYLR
jgi:predicted TIM-barrel fold metal-dependent hydrolase